MVVKGRALETRSLWVTRRLGVMPGQLEAEDQMTGLSSRECETEFNNVALSGWASLWLVIQLPGREPGGLGRSVRQRAID